MKKLQRRFAPTPAALPWNQWPVCSGITGRFQRNTHLSGFRRIKAKCYGYPNYYDHKDETLYRAPNCKKGISLRPSRLTEYRTIDDGVSVFLDAAKKRWRCANCSNAASIVRKRETRVKEFMVELGKLTQAGSPERQVISDVFKKFEFEWSPGQKIPVIRSFAELGKIEKACAELSQKFPLKRSVKTQHGQEVLKPFRFDGGRFQLGRKIHTARPQDEKNKLQRLIGHLCREESAHCIQGICPGCNEFMFSPVLIKVHEVCGSTKYPNDRREHWHKLMEQTPPGTRAERENSRKYYNWFTRHKLWGESLHDIAKDSCVQAQPQDLSGMQPISSQKAKRG
jgi:hypothetical protein